MSYPLLKRVRQCALPLLLTGTLALTACDDDTSMIGYDIMPGQDKVEAISSVYHVNTATVQADSVLANTSTCYLGSIVDPELRIKTTSNFLAQFHLPQNFELPAESVMLKDADGKYLADSCDIRIYIDSFYGDSLTTMKLNVKELDTDNILEENRHYYTNLNAADYVKATSPYNRSLSYAVKDLSRPESENNGTTYYRQIAVKMPIEYASYLLNSYYEHPDYFRNSYTFIHRICPGFYFESAGGVGVMLNTAMMSLNVYFRYHTTNSAGNDTIVDGMQRFGATQEVIQSTAVDNEYAGQTTIANIAERPYTYVKSPSCFFTEMTLPVDSIAAGTHYADSVSQAKFTVYKLDDETAGDYRLTAPEYLLLVRKAQMKAFFENNQLPDSYDSYLSSQCTATNNYYNFSNIAQLITNLKLERDKEAGVADTDTEAQREAKYKTWQEANPDWNKVLLVPINATYTSSASSYSTSYVLQSVKHQLGLRAARLDGGKGNPIKMQVIYSKYNR